MYGPGDKQKRAISRHPICLTNSDCDFILEEIGRQEELNLKEMWKFIMPTREINTIIFNEYYMFIIYLYINYHMIIYLFPCSESI